MCVVESTLNNLMSGAPSNYQWCCDVSANLAFIIFMEVGNKAGQLRTYV